MLLIAQKLKVYIVLLRLTFNFCVTLLTYFICINISLDECIVLESKHWNLKLKLKPKYLEYLKNLKRLNPEWILNLWIKWQTCRSPLYIVDYPENLLLCLTVLHFKSACPFIMLLHLIMAFFWVLSSFKLCAVPLNVRDYCIFLFSLYPLEFNC